ncbi:MAG: GAF domain-containing protein [Chloroflexi bacterium]|nr:GAF domain-containing protein [Chloroflexota bacterium]
MASRKLLVVTGDYSVVQQVKRVLGAKSFAIYTAYSHLDAVYQLKYELFELVLIDAAMIHRKSGERTAATLAQMDKRPPVLVYAQTDRDSFAPETVIDSLDEATLCDAVAEMLSLPPLIPKPAVQDKQPEMNGAITSIFWRNEEMQTLFALGRSLTEVLDLSEVLNRIVEAARHLTNAEEGMILLPDGQTGQLYLRAKVGIDQKTADKFRIKTQDSLAGTVFETGQSILMSDSGPQKVKTEYFVNSLLYVAILHKGRTLGVLGVNNKVKHDVFTERHRDMLVNLATYAAIAIENARIHGQSIRRQHELKALIDASQSINASLSFDLTLPAICEQLMRVLNVGHAEIYTWDDQSQQLFLLARCQQAFWKVGHEPLIRLADRPAARMALDNGRPVFIQTEQFNQRDIRGEQIRLKQLGASAVLALPIFGGDQMIACLMAYYLKAPETAPAHETTLRVERSILEGLAGFSGENDHGRFVNLLAEVKILLGADWLEMAEVSQEKNALKLQFMVGGGVWMDDERPAVDLSAYPDVLDALQRQQPLNHYASEENLQSGIRAFLNATYSRSVLLLPLIGHGQTLGLVLFADIQHMSAFSAREINLGRAVVSQAAIALENVGLVHDLEASLVELKEAQSRIVQGARLSAMGELAAAIAHQINNPLTTIVLDTELLLESRTQDTKDYEVLSAISRAGKRAAGVVRRLLSMARPIASDTPRSPIDVVYTIRDITTLVRPHIEREGIHLTSQLPENGFPPVLAVAGELNDVWLNLILNAHDAVIGRKSPEIGVTCTLDSENDMIEVIVWDNGPGIPVEIIGEIFKPFFTTKPQGEGTGLGLHICRQVVDRVGGVISVQTSDSGSRFVVRLPIMRST